MLTETSQVKNVTQQIHIRGKAEQKTSPKV